MVLLPPLAVPLHLFGQRVADGLDDDPTNGVFALGPVLGIGVPALLAAVVAYRRVAAPITVLLGIVTGALSAGVLLAAFVIYCNATDCIV